MNRFGAFGIHLGISLLIFTILGYLILFHWYPDFFFTSDGGWQGIRIVAFVDLVLGPTLTLVVFNPAKPAKELRRDLSIIGVFQLACLTAGTYVVYSERPIAMVYSDGTFTSMTVDDYLEVGQPLPDLKQFPDGPPVWVSVHLPEDPGEQSRIRESAIEQRKPLRTYAEYYEAFQPDDIDPMLDGLPYAQLRARDAKTPFISDFLKSHTGTLEDYIFLPFGTRYRLALLAKRRESDELIYLAIPLDTQAS